MIPLRDTQRSFSTPVVTVCIIIVNVLVFLFQISLDAWMRNDFIAYYGVVPDRLHYSSVLTSMFLHGGWMHLIGNMWFLWIFGDNVEDVLGHAKYLFFYIACGVAAALIHILVYPDSRIPTIGASGAIAGVMGAYLVKFPRSRIVTLIPIIIFFTTMEVPAAFMLVYWFIIQVFQGVGSVGYSNVSSGGVAWFAHVGGFIAGMVLVHVLGARERFSNRGDLRW